ncbi:TIGR03915 family putative DNA repair protein [Gorillibacterium sp. sgz500922]|uniref:TIGR03915 family putative DNA repair protein n=1 Tax=Gorillibacterium sp. sgz500922 TaxID=3446694 RepID=UPI003F673EFE
MPDRTDVAYRYDGSFEGWLTCVFECFRLKEQPLDIRPFGAEELILFDEKDIPVDEVKARRVEEGIRRKLGAEGLELVRNGFLTCHPSKELLLLRFVRMGLAEGPRILEKLTDDTVHELNKAVQALTREAHSWLGFLRFSARGSVLVAEIEPQNEVLPLIADHFCDRFGGEAFLIHDRTHRKALAHRPGKHVFLDIEELSLPEESGEELMYQQLWQRFYETIGIEERANPRARMNHMPKRYWGHLPEMAAERIADSKQASLPANPPRLET